MSSNDSSTDPAEDFPEVDDYSELDRYAQVDELDAVAADVAATLAAAGEGPAIAAPVAEAGAASTEARGSLSLASLVVLECAADRWLGWGTRGPTSLCTHARPLATGR